MRAAYCALTCLALLFCLASFAKAESYRTARQNSGSAYSRPAYSGSRAYNDYTAQRNRYYPPAPKRSHSAPQRAYSAPQNATSYHYPAAPKRYSNMPQRAYKTQQNTATYRYTPAPKRAYNTQQNTVIYRYHGTPQRTDNTRKNSALYRYPAAPKRAYTAPQRAYSTQQNANIYRYHGAPQHIYKIPEKNTTLYRPPAAPKRVYTAPQRAYSAPSRPYKAPARIYKYATPYNGGGYKCRNFPYPNAGGTYTKSVNTAYNYGQQQNRNSYYSYHPLCSGFSSNVTLQNPPYAAPRKAHRISRKSSGRYTAKRKTYSYKRRY